MRSLWLALIHGGLCGLLTACPQPDPEGPCGTWYPDVDGDSYGDASAPVEVCAPALPPANLVTRAGDCNDDDASVNAGVNELCDGTGVDEDCDGFIDDEDDNLSNGRMVWLDYDGDGFGDPTSSPTVACLVPEGTATNDEDCDDLDAQTFPGSAEADDREACMTDSDGDGYGSDRPGPGVAAGGDCDDDDPLSSPGAVEQLDDGIDQTCTGDDRFHVSDGFEAGVVDRFVVDTLDGATVTTTEAASGAYSVRLPSQAALTTQPVGTSRGCETLRWSFAMWRGSERPDVGDFLTLQRWNGTSFQDVAMWGGTGARDHQWSWHTGQLTEADAYRDDLRLRWATSTMSAQQAFHIDDIEISCTGPDTDGDGFGSNVDCSPDDAAHWLDCLTCMDPDEDDYGEGCDAGPDCAPNDPAIHPGAIDDSLDSVDQDCNVADGPAFLERFEDRTLPAWRPLPPEVRVDGVYAANGFGSLRASGTGSAVIDASLDLSECTEVVWVLLARRGPSVSTVSDELTLDWTTDAGATWNVAFTLEGGTSDPEFLDYRGTISTPDVLAADVRFRISHRADPVSVFYIDDLAIGCDPVDADKDGFWAGLEDCDDTTGTTAPGVEDIFGDGVDQDCDGIDG